MNPTDCFLLAALQPEHGEPAARVPAAELQDALARQRDQRILRAPTSG